MRVLAICAFREPYDGAFVQSTAPGAEIEIPDAAVSWLVSLGYIAAPALIPASAASGAAVAIGSYTLFQDADGSLQIRAPDGALIPLVLKT